MAKELAEKIKLLNSNWTAYALAEAARDYDVMNILNQEHRELCAWLAAHGMPFHQLAYNTESSTFSVPESIMPAASQ